MNLRSRAPINQLFPWKRWVSFCFKIQDPGLTPNIISQTWFFDPVLNERRGNSSFLHSWNPFCRNSPHINISAEVGHVRWQITEVENKESGEMFQGSRLTHRELETRVDLLNDPSPVSSPLFFFPLSFHSLLTFPSSTFPSHARQTLAENRRLLRIAINRDRAWLLSLYVSLSLKSVRVFFFFF